MNFPVKSIVILGACLSSAVVAGPVSKWDDREPKFRYETAAGIFDVQRCLDDLDGVPIPRQIWYADRPNEVKLIWEHPSLPVVVGRLDASRIDNITTVTAWNLADSAIERLKKCAPPVTR